MRSTDRPSFLCRFPEDLGVYLHLFLEGRVLFVCLLRVFPTAFPLHIRLPSFSSNQGPGKHLFGVSLTVLPVALLPLRCPGLNSPCPLSSCHDHWDFPSRPGGQGSWAPPGVPRPVHYHPMSHPPAWPSGSLQSPPCSCSSDSRSSTASASTASSSPQ